MRSLSIPTDGFTAGRWDAGVPCAEGSSSPFSPCHPPSLCLLLFLQKHSLSGLISSICCNHEQIQITTFPCGGHMSLLRTEVALSLPHRGKQGTQGRETEEREGALWDPGASLGPLPERGTSCLAFSVVASAVQRAASGSASSLRPLQPPPLESGCSFLISTWRCLT